MRKKFARVLACALSASMLAALPVFAEEAETEEVTEEVTEGEEEEVDVFPAYDLGGVTITLLKHNNMASLDPDADDLDEVTKADRQANIDRVEEKYNVNLEFVDLPTDDWDSIASEIVSAYTAGHPVADVMQTYLEFLGTYVSNDILYDMTDAFEQIGTISEDAYFNFLGKVWGTSSGIGGEGIYYNKKWIQDLGMEYTPAEMFARGMWDYDNFVEYLRELKSKMAEDEYPLFISPGYWFLFAPKANGISIFEAATGKLNYVADPMLETLQVFQDCLAEGLISFGDPVYNEDGTLRGYEGWSYPGNTFGQGQTVAMAHRASWQAADEVNRVDPLGFVPYPWGSNVTVENVGEEDAYLTLSDNYHSAYFDAAAVVLTKGIEEKGDPAQIYSMVLDLLGSASHMKAYQADTDTRSCGWLEDGLDKDLYFWSLAHEELEIFDCISDGLGDNLTYSLGFLRESTSVRSSMLSYYNADLQALIDAGFTTEGINETYDEPTTEGSEE